MNNAAIDLVSVETNIIIFKYADLNVDAIRMQQSFYEINRELYEEMKANKSVWISMKARLQDLISFKFSFLSLQAEALNSIIDIFQTLDS